jgi:hypothetical protein
LDKEALEERLTTAWGLAGRDLTEYARYVDLEHGDNALRLGPEEPDRHRRHDRQTFPLPQIGSVRRT